MNGLSNTFWLGTKELRILSKNLMMILFIVWSFGFSIYFQSKGGGETINNAAVAIVDEDGSALSRSIRGLFYPPYFKVAPLISASDTARAMDQSLYTFILVIPPNFEADLRRGGSPELQLAVDATAVQQAGLGAGYIQNMVAGEVRRHVARSDDTSGRAETLVVRRAFNPGGTQSWFRAVVGLLDQLSMLTIVLTGASLLREREHGTIEHLLVMPLTSFEIAMANVWSNSLVIFVSFVLSMVFVVEGALDVPIAGSRGLLLAGTVIYLFAAAAIGILLGTVARTMAQFALLMMMVVMPMMMLSGGMSPIESQPAWLQPLTWLLPSRHYMSFAQAIIYRGAGFSIVWKEFLTVAALGAAFLGLSLLLFRRSIATSR